MDEPPSGADDGASPPVSPAAAAEALEHSRVEAAQLRARNAQQEAVLRRPLVRVARRLDRDGQKVVASAGRTLATLRSHADLAALRLRARATADQRRARAAALDERRATLAPPPAPVPGVAMIVVGSRVGDGAAPAADGVEIDVIPTDGGAGTEGARQALATATRPLVALLLGTSEPIEPGWLARLAGAVAGDVVAAVPVLVHPQRDRAHQTPHDLAIRAAGIDVVDDVVAGPRPVAVAAGRPIDDGPGPGPVAAGSAAAIVLDRRAVEAVGGLAAIEPLDAAVIDLCARLRAAGGTIERVPDAIVLDHRPVPSTAQLTTPLDPTGAAWRQVVERRGATLVRAGRRRPTDPLRVTITTAVPTARAAPQWGDWHLAEALGRGLTRLGPRVRVQRLDQADDLAGRADDVRIVLRGQAPVRRTGGQTHVLWVISHPEAVDPEEYDEADLVLVASARLAASVRARTTTPVEVLLQATDHHRFRPRPRDPAHRHRVAIVATTRHVFRRSVADALAVGIRPAIYGSGWHEFVDPELIVSEFIPNADLPVVYSSVDVLLNDHWDTMRSGGFVANRLFDALACGTPVVSDHLPEIAELFGDAVATYRTRDELADAVAVTLADPDAARRRAEAGRQLVLAGHTFDHRAATVLEALERHDLQVGPW